MGFVAFVPGAVGGTTGEGKGEGDGGGGGGVGEGEGEGEGEGRAEGLTVPLVAGTTTSSSGLQSMISSTVLVAFSVFVAPGKTAAWPPDSVAVLLLGTTVAAAALLPGAIVAALSSDCGPGTAWAVRARPATTGVAVGVEVGVDGEGEAGLTVLFESLIRVKSFVTSSSPADTESLNQR